MFELVDRDGDGRVDAAEFAAVFSTSFRNQVLEDPQ